MAQVAVSAEDEQPRGIEVKAPDSKEPGYRSGHEPGYARPPERVAHRGEVPCRLIEHESHRRTPQVTRFPSTRTSSADEYYLASQSGGDGAVDGDATGRRGPPTPRLLATPARARNRWRRMGTISSPVPGSRGGMGALHIRITALRDILVDLEQVPLLLEVLLGLFER